MGLSTDPYVFSPGANNNASGVAACLEIARVLKKKNFQPKSTIRFIAFGSEEFMTMFANGKSGAEQYVSQISNSQEKVRLMIDNNQISYAPTNDWKLDFQNCPNSEWATQLAHNICQRYTRITPVDTNDHIQYTDVYYFWKAGHPTIFFEEYHFNPYTFTEKDIIENCNIAYCAEVTKISWGVLIYCNY
jgi:Zn-dependent M28 family amino/carboxypeptidase